MRREYEHGEGAILGVARKFEVYRRMVRQALAGALPPVRKYVRDAYGEHTTLWCLAGWAKSDERSGPNQVVKPNLLLMR
ncbi:MAG: hypothetical protein KGL31_12505 [candidate division NC10 bacterium]|nr:hypothetical protein [candidate division NC10 bacterium]MDE2322712.1 hypothetical protein [candidate division NC10 bacterium]